MLLYDKKVRDVISFMSLDVIQWWYVLVLFSQGDFWLIIVFLTLYVFLFLFLFPFFSKIGYLMYLGGNVFCRMYKIRVKTGLVFLTVPGGGRETAGGGVGYKARPSFNMR